MTDVKMGSSGTLHVRVKQQTPMPLEGSFACEPGQLLALVGPSGAGKTSMLRALAGLIEPTQGRISVGDEVWFDSDAAIHRPPRQRHVGLVFQDYALMPHLSALDNVALSLLHLPPRERRARAHEWLDHVRLSAEQRVRKPAALSGGQQQRVAVARALAREPRLLLLDEPFSAVDQMSRQGLYDLLADLRRDLCIPIILVTHDLTEARQLADSLVVMDDGKILQQGPPAQIYRSPRNARVADLVGVQNRFHGRWLGAQSEADRAQGTGWLEWLPREGVGQGLRLRVRDKGRLSKGQLVTWVIQGDGLHIVDDLTAHTSEDTPGCITLRTTVTALRNLGETSLATVAVDGLEGVSIRLILSGPSRQRLVLGGAPIVRLDCDWVHVMPTKSDRPERRDGG